VGRDNGWGVGVGEGLRVNRRSDRSEQIAGGRGARLFHRVAERRVLQWSLRYVAGVRRTARKEKPALRGRDDGVRKEKQNARGRMNRPYASCRARIVEGLD